MRGRKPHPNKLTVIDGGASYTSAGKPRPPTCPAHLNPTAKAEWKRLAWPLFERGIIGDADRASLAAYCQAYGRWVEAERKLSETPMLIKLPSGYIQQSPWLAIANKQLEIMARYLSELGLSPVSRTRVAVRPNVGPRPWDFGRGSPGPRAADLYLKPRR